MKLNISFFILVFILTSSYLTGQELYIDGHVTDDTGEPLPFATLMVYDADSAMVDGLSTDENGYFRTDLKNSGTYRLHFQYLSFDDLIIENIEITDAPHTIEERSEEHTSELQSRGHLVC